MGYCFYYFFFVVYIVVVILRLPVELSLFYFVIFFISTGHIVLFDLYC